MFNKCHNLLRKPHCCHVGKSGALGTSGSCQLNESERSYYDSFKQNKVDTAFELTLEELKFIDIEGTLKCWSLSNLI